MFQMTVDDVLIVQGNVAISGRCVDRNGFTSRLVDEDGTVYIATIPFIKHVVPPELDYVTLELSNIPDPASLMGRVLSAYAG